MRSLGMGEETKDEIIDNYVVLVTKQQVIYCSICILLYNVQVNYF